MEKRVTANAKVIEAYDRFDPQQKLVLAARGGDRQAFEDLYQCYVAKVYGICLRLLFDQGLAEDATQEVFIQVWRGLPNFKQQSKFSTWIHSVATHVAISYLRKQKSWWQRWVSSDADISEIGAVDPQPDMQLDVLVERLPERARLVFLLHGVEGYRHEEVAKLLGIAEGSSKAQFFRAKQLIKQWMGYE